VLDPANHASRRVRVRVEVQYERPVGWQLERGRVRGGALRRSGCVSRPCHAV